MALSVAQEVGFKIDAAAFKGLETWLRSVTDPDTGRAGYDLPGGPRAHDRHRSSAAGTRSRDPVLRETHRPVVGSFCLSIDEFQTPSSSAVRVIEGIDARTRSPRAATAELFELLGSAACIPPVFDLARPEAHCGGKFDVGHWHGLLRWGNLEAPAQVKEQLFRGDTGASLSRFTARGTRTSSGARRSPASSPSSHRTTGGAA